MPYQLGRPATVNNGNRKTQVSNCRWNRYPAFRYALLI
jgi:hypothetical protein